MAKKASKSKFRNKVASNTKKQKKGASYGYLDLPKGIKIFKEPLKDTVKLDIIPYMVTSKLHPDRDERNEVAMENTLWYKRPFKIHRNVGQEKSTEVCPLSVKKKCPIDDYREKLLKEGRDWKDKEVSSLKNSNRNLYVVIPRGSNDYDEVPHVWDISEFCFQELLNEEIETNEDYGIFPDLEEGLTLEIRFKAESIGTGKRASEFAKANRIDFIERKTPIDESILKQVPNLDELLNIKTYSELETCFFELDDDHVSCEKDPGSDGVEEIDGPDPDDPREDPDEPPFEPDEKEEPEPEPEPEPDRKKKTLPKESKTDSKEDRKAQRLAEREAEKKKKEEVKDDKNECPFGHRFGYDCDTEAAEDDCKKCEKWEDCMDKQEELEK